MEPTILTPVGPVAHVVRARTTRGPTALRLRGWPAACGRTSADRIRAAVLNSGFSLPAGRTTLWIEPELAEANPGTDLAAALALMLADPSRAHVRQSNLMAWGALDLDGTLRPADKEPMAELPDEGWVGRFWSHHDEVPRPDEAAVLTVIDVPDLSRAWEVIVRLLDIQAALLS
ncbi:MAG TPA: magnesium chelatase domain-containing protein [Actinomycetota bacterium]|nr:magnesium chelatase domain-containing protein [Actinomycetota bacterium]